MYVYEGNIGTPYSRLFRSDDVATGAPVFTDLTSANPADPGFATFNLCTGQCWYDVFVYTPKGTPTSSTRAAPTRTARRSPTSAA